MPSTSADLPNAKNNNNNNNQSQSDGYGYARMKSARRGYTAHSGRCISVALGDAERCGPARFHCENGALTMRLNSGHVCTVYVSIPCVRLDDLRGTMLKDTIELSRALRSAVNSNKNYQVSFVDDGNLDKSAKKEWLVLLNAKRIIRREKAEKELSDCAIAICRYAAGATLWEGNLTLGTMPIPGFRLYHYSSNTINNSNFALKGDAKVVSVLPPSLSIGALMNSRNEYKCCLDNVRFSKLSVQFCKAVREAGSSLLVQIEAQHFIFRTASEEEDGSWIADVAPVRKLSDEIANALDVSSYRRDVLGLHGRSTIRKPHDEVRSLPVVEIARDKLQVVKYGANEWITDDEFANAVNVLGLKTKVVLKKETAYIRPPPHHSEASKLEHDTLREGDQVRKRPRSSPLLHNTNFVGKKEKATTAARLRRISRHAHPTVHRSTPKYEQQQRQFQPQHAHQYENPTMRSTSLSSIQKLDRVINNHPDADAEQVHPHLPSIKPKMIQVPPPFVAKQWLSVGLGDAQVCGHARFHCSSAEDLAAKLSVAESMSKASCVYVSVPCVKLRDLRATALKDTVGVGRILRNARKNNTNYNNNNNPLLSVCFVDDGNLDTHTKKEWMVLLGANRFIQREKAEKELADKAYASIPSTAANATITEAMWSGDLRFGNMIVPGFQIGIGIGMNRNGDVAAQASNLSHISLKGEAKIISVLPPCLSIGALMNTKNELECSLSEDFAHLSVLFCRAVLEAGTCLLVQIESQHFLLRPRTELQADGSWVADVACIRRVSAEMSHALDVSAYRREELDIHGRSSIRKPHDEVCSLPVVELVTIPETGGKKLQMLKHAADKWITDDEFSDAVNILGMKYKGKRNGGKKVAVNLREPLHHSEAAKLEHDVLRGGDEVRKRARNGDMLGAGMGTMAGTIAGTPGSFYMGSTPRTSRITPGSSSTPFTAQRSIPSTATGNTGAWTTRGGTTGGNTQAAMRMNRKARLQRQVAVRSANARRQTRASAAISGMSSRRFSGSASKAMPQIARKYPDTSVVRSLEPLAPFIASYTDAANTRVEEMIKLLVPLQHNHNSNSNTHGVEWAADTHDERDATLHKYENHVGRCEQEHASAWQYMRKNDAEAVVKIDQCLQTLRNATSASSTFSYRR